MPNPKHRTLAGSGSRRQRRADGDTTRAGIIEAAGRLFAERGYQGATGKAICEQAGVNIAAINYHFGGRENLYLSVLKAVHHRFMSMDFMLALSASPLAPSEKLRSFFRELVHHILQGEDWATRVWAREVLAPTPMLERVLQENTLPKFELLAAIIGELIGIAPSDPRMPQLVLSMLAPCLLMLITERHTATPIQPLFAQPTEVLADGFWRFALSGLSGIGRD